MNAKIKTIIGIGAFVVFIGVSALAYNAISGKVQTAPPQSPQSDGKEIEKELAPEFTVYDADGGEVKPSDFLGKPVMINFWASWCPPCKSEMPAIEEKYTEYGEDVVFMMIDATDGARETKEKALDYVNGEGYTFPVYFDTTGEAMYSSYASAIPTTLFIDKDGYVTKRIVGAMSEKVLEENLKIITEETEKQLPEKSPYQ